ncbi:MAG: hypothetical protein K6C30_04755 [Bacteroidaceae bacterium]|nr:hypothetical protein [Bacteroidaceae bacterium]
MKSNQQTKMQIERAIRKVAAKFPKNSEPVLTDIHMQVIPESAELRTYNDDMEELDRAVIEQWLEPSEEDLYEVAATAIKQCLHQLRNEVEAMSILRPFSFVLMGEDGETICDLYIVDDDNIMLDTELLKGLDKELDEFLARLMKE